MYHTKKNNTIMANGVLKYRKYQDQRKGVPSSGKWYGRAVQDRTVEFADFVTHMANHNSPYSRGVINGVLMDMLSCLQELVLDGKAVRLGELGLISLGMRTKPADTAADFTTANIQGVHLNVRNTKTWSNAELRKQCRLEELAAYNKETGSTEDPGSGQEEGGGGMLG